MSKHTPEPWSFDPDTFVDYLPDDGHDYMMSVKGSEDTADDDGLRETVATIRGEDLGRMRANARLIAAAPELLEALRLVCDHLEDIDYRLRQLSVRRALKVAGAAIAKAEGK